MKTAILFSLLTLTTAQAQFSKLIDRLKQQKQQQQQQQPPAQEQPPQARGSFRVEVQEERTDPRFRRDLPPGWQPAQPEERPAYRPGSSAGLPGVSGRGSYPGWPQGTRPALPQEDPRYRPQPREPYYRPPVVEEDELFDPRVPPREEQRPRGMQDMVRELREREAREKEMERSISPGINRQQYRLPIQRPERPRLREESYRIWQNYSNNWNQWTIERNSDLNRFARQRPLSWQRLEAYRSNGQCWQRYGQEDWQRWSHDYYDYRRQRCYELWNACYWFAGQLYDNYWWSHCQWAGRPVPAEMPAWWWYQPAGWDALVQHLRLRNSSMEPRDPGVDVVYYGDRVYIGGQDAGSAEKHRNYDRDLAAKDWGWEPPFPGGRFDWLPLGVWALTPQEYGEASMILQLAISREGLINGAYTNVLTGEEFPVMGRADVREQRAAWRIGNSTATIMETGLGGLTWDVAGAFMHFARGDTQVWQLTRLPMPGAPPGPVRLPRGR